MTGVWLVWNLIRTRCMDGTHNLSLVAVCENESVALEVVKEEQQAITRYYGPHYPPRWQRKLNKLQTQFGDEIKWEPWSVKEKAPDFSRALQR